MGAHIYDVSNPSLSVNFYLYKTIDYKIFEDLGAKLGAKEKNAVRDLLFVTLVCN